LPHVVLGGPTVTSCLWPRLEVDVNHVFNPSGNPDQSALSVIVQLGRHADTQYNAVSDTASTDATVDRSGPTIKNILQERGFDCTSPTIVPDDETQIQSFVKDCSERGNADWIVTTGGTGFGVRDRTPEVKIICLSSQPL
jgi:hypothetical protein